MSVLVHLRKTCYGDKATDHSLIGLEVISTTGVGIWYCRPSQKPIAEEVTDPVWNLLTLFCQMGFISVQNIDGTGCFPWSATQRWVYSENTRLHVSQTQEVLRYGDQAKSEPLQHNTLWQAGEKRACLACPPHSSYPQHPPLSCSPSSCFQTHSKITLRVSQTHTLLISALGGRWFGAKSYHLVIT